MINPIKHEVKERDKFCQICGNEENLTVDHIIPLVEGGTDDINNLRSLCKNCNHRKGPVPPFWQRVINLFNGNLYWFKNEMRAKMEAVRVGNAKFVQSMRDSIKTRLDENNKEVLNLAIKKLRKMTLKQTLIEYLQRNKRLDLNQLYSLCGREQKKTSNAERRLRELMSPLHKDYNPNIKAEKNAKGAITVYVWQEKSYMVTATLGPAGICKPDKPCFIRQKFKTCRCVLSPFGPKEEVIKQQTLL